MSAVIAWLIGQGLPERFAKPLLIALGVVAIVAALGAAKCSYDHRLIANHDAAANAKAEHDARQLEHRADAVTNPITNANAAEQAARQEAIRNATNQHPQHAARPVGPASNAVIDRLRQRQRGAHKTSP